MEYTSRYYRKNDPVSIVPLDAYRQDEAKAALEKLLAPIGGLDFIKPGAHVVIKANLVSAMHPEKAATTHPVLLSALCEMIAERGAHVTIGDSPGGLYNSVYVNRVYSVSGMKEVKGAALNQDFSQKEGRFPEGKILQNFTYTSYLDQADVIINFAKLKSHGMMGMSCAAKNMFGAIPGVIKPEYHYRFPKYEVVADMILDLDEFFHPTLSIVDAVIGMEGNGPTAGTPRQIGCLLASHSPHTLDAVATRLIRFIPEEIPTVAAAMRRGMIPENISEIPVIGNLDALYVNDFERVAELHSLQFAGTGKNPIKRAFSKVASKILATRPKLKPNLCVGCGICRDICPAKAIVIKNGKAKIDRSACIRCFCCQEFCPKSAMKVYRAPIAKLFHREKKKP